MLTRYRKVLWTMALFAALTSTAIVFVPAQTRTDDADPQASGQAETSVAGQTTEEPLSATTPQALEYVRRAQLWPTLPEALAALGDRLEKPGKERLTLRGTVSRRGDAQSAPLLLVWEYPGLIRLEEQSAGGAAPITFNGREARRNNQSLDRPAEDLLETLAYDSAEHFFVAQVDGSAATRFLGRRFRADENAAAPFYDIYQTTETIRVGQAARRQTKQYFFNSETHLLERVRYQIRRDGATTGVEVRLSEWRTIAEQRLPTRVVRLENGEPTLTFTFTSLNVGSRVADGLFN